MWFQINLAIPSKVIASNNFLGEYLKLIKYANFSKKVDNQRNVPGLPSRVFEFHQNPSKGEGVAMNSFLRKCNPIIAIVSLLRSLTSKVTPQYRSPSLTTTDQPTSFIVGLNSEFLQYTLCCRANCPHCPHLSPVRLV